MVDRRPPRYGIFLVGKSWKSGRYYMYVSMYMYIYIYAYLNVTRAYLKWNQGWTMSHVHTPSNVYPTHVGTPAVGLKVPPSFLIGLGLQPCQFGGIYRVMRRCPDSMIVSLFNHETGYYNPTHLSSFAGEPYAEPLPNSVGLPAMWGGLLPAGSFLG